MGQISGEVTIESGPHQIRGGVLRVRLVDVSRADAAAVVISQAEITDVDVESGDERFEFTLDAPPLDPRATYAVEAHLDADGSGETSVGDYRTMEHIGVPSPDETLSVPVRPVG